MTNTNLQYKTFEQEVFEFFALTISWFLIATVGAVSIEKAYPGFGALFVVLSPLLMWGIFFTAEKLVALFVPRKSAFWIVGTVIGVIFLVLGFCW